MNHRYTGAIIFIVLLSVLLSACMQADSKKISIIETTDLHGVILPWDYIENNKLDASLAGTAGYIKNLRNRKNNVFLLDNGDNLQGQPAVYYYNFIDTVSPHLLSEAMNWLGYDACTVGNHDIEAGHSVYDRLVKEYRFPLLAANSYRGNGGGGHLTRGAGIKNEDLRSRLISSTDRDLRYYILKSSEEKKILNPEPFNNWKIIPENWVKIRIPQEYLLLFGTTI